MGKTGKAVTYDQIKKIYAAAGERGMDNDLLHEHMEMLLHKTSIKELTKREAVMLIDVTRHFIVDGKSILFSTV